MQLVLTWADVVMQPELRTGLGNLACPRLCRLINLTIGNTTLGFSDQRRHYRSPRRPEPLLLCEKTPRRPSTSKPLLLDHLSECLDEFEGIQTPSCTNSLGLQNERRLGE